MLSCLVPNSWRPHDKGRFKANSDVALDMLYGKVGVGIIIRDHLGKVLASCSLPIVTVLAPNVTKATAILRGFIFTNESGLLPCTLESDAQVVVKLINRKSIPLSDIVIIISDIICLLDDHLGCKVVFAPRQANMAGHMLAKVGLSSTDDLFRRILVVWLRLSWAIPQLNCNPFFESMIISSKKKKKN
ncbi:hypothetical protein Ddye_004878 [Dipteronia dyeriana]|uniref:RNase H type-1 domain-containing protein n=1 Tax=Dipteronia dyeriana TaxID=168575 RepID=A0AAE0CP36_9ROSI|nr:hypothetical protein Ddye_004878 [Dipteronia dyeriana]